MTRNRPPRFLTLALAAAAILTLGLAGCSSSDDGDAQPAVSTTQADAGTDGTMAADGEADNEPTEDQAAAPVGEVATAEAAPSAGCGTSTVGRVTDERHEVGADRWYLLNTPDEHDGTTPLPLVVDFHGLSEGAEIHGLFSAIGPFSQENGFVTVLPNGTGTPVAWNVSPDRTANPDLVFVDALLDQVSQDLCIDTSRIYATGLSNGAFMSSVLACTMADRFAAVAPVAGLQRPASCDPSRPVPVLAFHGTADPILLFNGGINADALAPVLNPGGAEPAETATTTTMPPADLNGEGYPAAAQAWADGNGCTGEPTDTDLTDTVIERTWDCPAASPVVFEILEGHGHSWPGSSFGSSIEAIVGPTDLSVSANELMWAFFQRFALPTG